MLAAFRPSSLVSPNLEPPGFSHVEYRPDIDGLRAVAVLAVVGAHAYPKLIKGGGVGVDVFFVISGFLISGIIYRGLQHTSFSFFDFYARRVRRIFPALILMLATVWSLGWLFLQPEEFHGLGREILAGAGFVANLNLYEYVKHDPHMHHPPILGHLWSLGVEEQFYLVWPVFLFITWKFTNKRFISIALITTASFALSVAMLSRDPLGPSFLPWNRFWELSMGGMLAYAQVSGMNELNQPRLRFTVFLSWLRVPFREAQALIGAGLIIGSIHLTPKMIRPEWFHLEWLLLVPTIGALLLISSGPKSWINRCVLATRPMVFIGRISYPLYLWHWPLLQIARFVAEDKPVAPVTILELVSIAFVLAFLTYKYVELPLRAFSNNKTITTVLSVLMVASGSVGYMSFR